MNAAGVSGPTTCARSTRARTRLDPPGQGHPHHGAVGEGAQRHRGDRPGAEGPALGLRGAVGREVTVTYIGTTDTDYDGPLDDPQCTPEDVAYLLDAMNVVGHEPSPRTTSSARGPGCGRSSRRRVGEKTADLSRRHTVRVSDSGVVTVTGGKLTTYRRMAADTVDAVVDALGRKRPQPHQAEAARRRRAGTRPTSPTSTSPAATAPMRRRRPRDSTRRRPTSASRSCPACRTGGPRRCYAVRARDGHDARRRALAPHPRPAPRPRRLGRRRRRRRPLIGRRARAGTTPSSAARSSDVPGRSSSTSATPPACPATALDRARCDARRRRSTLRGDHQAHGRLRARRRRRSRSHGRRAPTVDRRASPRTRVEVDDALAPRARRPAPRSRRRRGAVVRGEPRLVAARDDLGARRPGRGTRGAVVRPADAGRGRARSSRRATTATVPVTAAAGRSGVCGASVPVHGGVVLDLTATRGIVDVDTESMLLDVLPGTFGTWLEDTLRAEHGVTFGHWPQSIDLSTVGGWLACRGAGQLSTRYGKIEDMVVGLDVVLADGRTITHRRRAARRGRPRPQPAVRRLRGHARRHHRRPAPRCTRRPAAERRAAYAFASFAAALDACAASSTAARRPRCCASTTRSRPTARYQTGDAARAARARRGRPAHRRRDDARRRRGVRGGRDRSTSSSSSSGSATATT